MSEDFESFQRDLLENKTLTPEELQALEYQNSRIVSEHKANLLETQAKKHWDLFYKRNETRFFRDRHWTTREFAELLGEDGAHQKKVLFEIGCGVGNFLYPLLAENSNLKIVACDLSPRAVEFVKSNPLYIPEKIQAFPCDITSEEVFNFVEADSFDVVTLIFVLSAIHPNKFIRTLKNIFQLLKPGGLILFRDYGLFDMAQLRFKPGNKISENFYMRHDGTRTYFFSIDFVKNLFEEAGYIIHLNAYVHRRTINKKDNIDVRRIFSQLKAQKPK